MKWFLVIITLLFFWGCEKKEDGKRLKKSQGKEENVLHLSFSSAISTLNPRISNEYPTAHVIRALFEGLMSLGPNGEVILGVAESYEISENQQTYTFYLRDSFWTNGEPVTAYDFEYAWKKSINPKYAQPGAYTFYSILNVAACLEGRVNTNEVGIRALDDKTLVVQLEYPAPYFLYLTTCPTFSPINREVDLASDNWYSSLSSFVSNGPFRLKWWGKNDHISLSRNDLYWNKNQVRLNGINIYFINDSITQFYMFEKGKLDWVGDPISPLSRDIINNNNLKRQMNTIPSAGLNWFFINTEVFPLNNKNFRKALALSIDRHEIVKYLLQTGEVPATSILGSSLQLQDSPIFEDGNVELAQEYLKKALDDLGITKEEIPPLKISCRKDLDVLRYIQTIQYQWYKALGLNIEIKQEEWPTHVDNLKKGNYQIGEMGWVSWLNDPIYMLQTFRSRSLNVNYSHWEHPVYKSYLDQSDYEIDEKIRRELLTKAEKFLLEEMPVLPIYFNVTRFFKNKDLQGVYVSPLSEIDFKFAYFSCEQ